jgi:glycosyltransferase involved in cell wall biosynthesis
MSLLLFNLATDADDPILGFTTTWINRLAEHYEYIDVITMRAGRLAVAPNVRVYSVGKERGYSEARRVFEFYRLLLRLRRQRSYTACFAHMMPLFAVMGAPLLAGVPITLWYTHRQTHSTLQRAVRVSYRVVTAAPDSFPIPTHKLRVIGHGIDTDFFSPGDTLLAETDAEPRILHVARLMPIKRQSMLIRALPEVPGARAVFVGDVPPETDPVYRAELDDGARDLVVTERVTFAGSLPPPALRDQYRRAAVAVNLSPAGLFDKAALESMAVGVPTLVTNPAFDDLLRDPRLCLPDSDDSSALAARLRDLLALDEGERRAIGVSLRERVAAAHSLDGLIGRLVSVLNTGEPE